MVLLAVFFAARPAHATIDYAVSIAHPETHTFAVTMHIPSVRDRVTLQMPAWNALYQIRDFSSHVMQVSARDDAGKTLPLTKVDKQTWRVRTTGNVTVTYPVYWDEPGPFGTQLNPEHAFINLAMVLLYVPDRRKEDTRISFDNLPASWRTAVELEPAVATSASPSTGYAAPNYDALVDAPVEIGQFDEFRFEAGGRPIRVVVHGEVGDRSSLTDTLKRIVNYQVSLMGDAPFREYMFMFHVGPNFGGGGMEHANCTAISADVPAQLPSYSAHEFFHTWNVKRIRPQTLEPVDYTKEMWTRSLWFAEGVTNTYGAYTLERTGLWSPQELYANLSSQINELESRPAHRWQSVEQSSLDAWYEKYPLYNRSEESVSYYTKGQIVGVMLDIVIRDRTDNRASLDDVMRDLNVNFAQRGRFYNERQDLQAVAEEVIRNSSAAADANLEDFFTRYVSGTDEIPFSDFLGRAGLSIRDTGPRHAAFDFMINSKGNAPVTIESLAVNGEAQRAGLKDGDVLLTLNGEAPPRNAERWLHDHQPGDRVALRVRRSGQDMEFSITLGWQTPAIYQITELSEVTEKQRRIRNGLLHGITDPSR